MGTFPFWSLHCDNQKEKKGKENERERRSLLDGRSHPLVIFYKDDKTEISDIHRGSSPTDNSIYDTYLLPASEAEI